MTITPASTDEDIQYLQCYAKLLRIENEETAMIKSKVMEAMEWVQARMNTVMPRNDDSGVHSVYDSKFGQIVEAPAVIEELKGTLGSAFVRAVLPGLYEKCRDHRLNHTGLRDSNGLYEH